MMNKKVNRNDCDSLSVGSLGHGSGGLRTVLGEVAHFLAVETD